MGGTNAAYMSFGRAIGSMDSGNTWLDVHGAGAQRSDPKTGNAADYPQSHGPQGDAQRVFNYARLVRDADITGTESDDGSSAPLPPESVEDNLAHFEANSQLLHIPVVDAGERGLYQVTLRLIGSDDRYTPGFLFELIETKSITGTPLATYNTQARLLTVPQVTVDNTVYAAEMTLISEGETMRFAVSALRE